eukprot:CAMPEP_0194132286 /NCGR_PEP_ID=MMETSP0152-20130528/2790_1 /TAXON_ID=1049557 /ORGANISM="Thalassiothrix antarctica, Strain L6-D1" /LENGTH=285 /DNA_ID=CAMNT_0038827285 /DNA_START=31 /DNA_END=885 /DNA_ORIENTATION=-
MANTIERRIIFMRRISMLLLFATAVFWLTLVDLQNGESSAAISLRTLSLLAQRPTIYVFSELPVTIENNAAFRTWNAAWSAAGFHTKLLTLENAREHTEFKAYGRSLGQIFKDRQLEETKARFYRYLAMNTIGGGLLADIDVFPLWPLSYDIKRSLIFEATNRFTVRCGSMHKPSSCLLSGSAQEWNRIAKELVDSMYLRQNEFSQIDKSIKTNNFIPWTEDHGLQELVSFARGHPLAQQETQVLSSEQAYEMRSTLAFFRKSQCHTDKIAVRFANTTIPTAKDW